MQVPDWIQAEWMEAPQATNSKWAPKETLENELREVKRPVNNINNILSEERGALWCLKISPFFSSLALLLCSIHRNMWTLSFSLLAETKKSCLLFWDSSSKPGSNPHLKWLSKELKAIRRSQEGLFTLTLTQQPKAYAACSSYTMAVSHQKSSSPACPFMGLLWNLWSSQLFWITYTTEWFIVVSVLHFRTSLYVQRGIAGVFKQFIVPLFSSHPRAVLPNTDHSVNDVH